MARILLIDDSPLQLLCMSRILQGLQHEVICYDASQKALEFSSREEIDLVMIELLMHTGNGFEVGLQMRETGYPSVFLFTGVYRETDEIWAQALGLAGVIARPVSPPQLQARIVTALKQKGSEQ